MKAVRWLSGCLAVTSSPTFSSARSGVEAERLWHNVIREITRALSLADKGIESSPLLYPSRSLCHYLLVPLKWKPRGQSVTYTPYADDYL